MRVSPALAEILLKLKVPSAVFVSTVSVPVPFTLRLTVRAVVVKGVVSSVA